MSESLKRKSQRVVGIESNPLFKRDSDAPPQPPAPKANASGMRPAEVALIAKAHVVVNQVMETEDPLEVAKWHGVRVKYVNKIVSLELRRLRIQREREIERKRAA